MAEVENSIHSREDARIHGAETDTSGRSGLSRRASIAVNPRQVREEMGETSRGHQSLTPNKPHPA